MVYGINAKGAKLLKTAEVPGDIGTVYWSPDGKHILGAGGNSLWIIDIPSLQARQLTTRNDWKADDACWLSKEAAVLVAARGVLNKVTLSGTTQEIWRFSDAYWR
jgi:hypothetical protein